MCNKYNIYEISHSDLASLSVGEFVGAAIIILEGITQHPSLLMEHQLLVINSILPELVGIIGSQNGKYYS